MKCPECGKFLSGVQASVNIFNDILKVEGTCRKHGTVQPTDWDWDDFFSEREQTTAGDGGGE